MEFELLKYLDGGGNLALIALALYFHKALDAVKALVTRFDLRLVRIETKLEHLEKAD